VVSELAEITENTKLKLNHNTIMEHKNNGKHSVGSIVFKIDHGTI